MASIKAEMLKNIGLELFCGNTEELMNLASSPIKFDFIFGIGTDGLTSFEYEIAGKSVGDEIFMRLKRNELRAKFEHLIPFFQDRLPDGDFLYFKIVISDIHTPDNNEVVKALAEIVGHGHDCGCGCCG